MIALICNMDIFPSERFVTENYQINHFEKKKSC